MSRGLGKVERAILEVLKAEPGAKLPTTVVAAAAYMSGQHRADFMGFGLEIQLMTCHMHPIRNAERVAVSRALHALWRADLVEKFVGGKWSFWRLPATVEPAR